MVKYICNIGNYYIYYGDPVSENNALKTTLTVGVIATALFAGILIGRYVPAATSIKTKCSSPFVNITDDPLTDHTESSSSSSQLDAAHAEEEETTYTPFVEITGDSLSAHTLSGFSSSFMTGARFIGRDTAERAQIKSEQNSSNFPIVVASTATYASHSSNESRSGTPTSAMAVARAVNSQIGGKQDISTYVNPIMLGAEMNTFITPNTISTVHTPCSSATSVKSVEGEFVVVRLDPNSNSAPISPRQQAES